MNQESKKQKRQENLLLLEANTLYQKMIQYLSPIYFPKSLEIDSIDTLVSNEFFRVRNILCRIYKFNENKHIPENDGTSLLIPYVKMLSRKYINEFTTILISLLPSIFAKNTL